MIEAQGRNLRTVLLGYSGAAIAGAMLIWLLLNCWTTVKPGHRGVVLLFGKVQPVALEPGLHFINPLMDVRQLNVQLQADTSKADAASHDLQQVHTEITVNYELDAPGTPKLYDQIGLSYAAKIIEPSVQEILKATTALYTAEDLISKREEVSSKFAASLKHKIEELSGRLILVRGVNIKNFRFGDAFEKSIEAKVVAEQNALTERNNRDAAKFRADQVIEAARGQAETFKLQNQQLSAQNLQLEWIKKWDGKLPTYVMGSDAKLLLNLPSKP
jgi:regulator of protease activity HflC (stomatin/prohibitin superfamily)